MWAWPDYTDVVEVAGFSPNNRLFRANHAETPVWICQYALTTAATQLETHTQRSEIQPDLPTPLQQWSDNQFSYVSYDQSELPISLSDSCQQLSGATLETRLAYMLQLTQLIEQFHRHHYVIGELRAQAIFVVAATNRLVLLDHTGISTISTRHRQTNPQLLDPDLFRTMAPEATGRIHATLDQRSDLYSLGVLCYLIGCGQYPFIQQQPIELVHAHLALPPPPLPEVPTDVASVIFTLLQKNPNQRYSQVAGVIYDLNQALQYAQRGETISLQPLSLRRGDQRLHFSNVLYGRDPELQKLQHWYQQLPQSPGVQVVQIAGYAGVGKSAFIDALYQGTLLDRPLFCRGKFDQYMKSQLFSAMAQILTELTEQLLQQSTAELASWQQHKEQLNSKEQALLMDWLPALQPLFGSDVTADDLLQPEDHFEQILLRFLRILCNYGQQQQRPLVLQLDDLQWADSATLQLLECIVSESQFPACLILLCYRDHEIDEVHPVQHLFQRWRKSEFYPHFIKLDNLSSKAISAFLADTLRQPVNAVAELSQLVLKKTSGNPFFVRQFLLRLQQDQLLFCDHNGHWRWDLNAIAAQNITDNLVELTMQRLQLLPRHALMLLQAAALAGERVELSLLHQVLPLNATELQQCIQIVVEAGILSAYSSQRGSAIAQVRFVHDRLQQAAATLIEPAQKIAWHRAMARFYLRQPAEERSAQQLFCLIDHLNAAGDAALDDCPPRELCQLNLQAAKQAQASHIWPQALQYYQHAIEVCPTEQVDFWFEAQYGYALSLYQTQQFSQATDLCQPLLAPNQPLLQRMQVAKLQILIWFASHDFTPAFALATEMLQQAGVEFVPLDAIAARYLALRGLYDPAHIEVLADLPTMQSAELQQVMEILNVLLTVAFVVSPQQYLAVSYAMVDLTIQHGLSPLGAKAYSTHAMNLASFGFVTEALAFSDLALTLNERQQGHFLAEMQFQRAATILHWNAPLRDSLSLLEQNIHHAMEQGNVEFAIHSALFFSFYQVQSGLPLDKVAADLKKYRHFIQTKGFAFPLDFLRIWQQFVETLQLEDSDPTALEGEAFAESTQLQQLEQAQAGNLLFCYHSLKLQLALMFQQDELACHHFAHAESLVQVAMSLYHQTEFYFYAALLACRQSRQAPEQRQHWQTKANDYLAMFQRWSSHASSNHQHKAAFIAAELADLTGTPDAWRQYDHAIHLASQSGMRHHLALIQEATAAYWLRQQKAEFARPHQQHALQQYQQWQAYRKVQQLQQAAPEHRAQTGQLLDLVSVLKAAETLSGRNDLSAFLQQMIDLIVENAGAQAGQLWLLDQDELVLKASAPAQHVQSSLTEQLQALVCRSAQPKLINDVSQELQFFHGVTTLPAAALAIPIIVSGQLYGVLFLEHFELTGAFTEERINVLQLLANQTAILFENTRLFHQVMDANKTLEQRVWERTQELASAKIRAESATAAKSSFLANMSHEIRTPINAVIGLSRLASKHASDADQRDYLEKIQEAGETLLSLVNGILDFSKIEAGKLELEQTRFQLDKVLQRAINLNALKAHAKGLEIVCQQDPAIPNQLLGDPLRLQQILVNLISNAVKFSDHGAIGIKVQLSKQESEQFELEVSVSDCGIGMTEEQQSQLFQSFHQADDSITRKYGGTGLGLAICKQLCEMMGGRIWLTSQPNQGTTFYFTLKLNAALEQVFTIARGQLPALRALVVDDIALARKVLVNQLQELGIEALQTDNGYQAVELVQQAKLRQQPFDFVLMDWRMPGMDGIETSRRIQQLDQAPHILMVSAYDKEEAKNSLQDVVIEQFIEKPVTPSQLLDAIYQLLDQHAMLEAKTQSQLQTVPNLSAYRILLAEDNPINRQVALGILQDSQVEVDVAVDGYAAIQCLQQRHYDLVLMDIQMPNMDGLSACEYIRQQLLLTELPIVAMTAHAMASDIARSKAAGMNAHLTKPIDPNELYATLVQFLPAGSAELSAATNNLSQSAPTDAEQLEILQQLASLPSLDSSRALVQLGGNTPLYLTLLADFTREQQQHSELLPELYQQQDWPKLYLAVHSLKSTSAYVGAFQLSGLCQQAESDLQHQQLTAELFNELQAALQQLLSELQQLPQSAQQQPQWHSLQHGLTMLLPLLTESDFHAEQVVSELLALAKHLPQWPQLCQIADDIQELEYEKAAQLCRDMLAEFDETTELR